MYNTLKNFEDKVIEAAIAYSLFKSSDLNPEHEWQREEENLKFRTVKDNLRNTCEALLKFRNENIKKH